MSAANQMNTRSGSVEFVIERSQRSLARTNDDRVDIKGLRLAVDRDVEAIVRDLEVFDAADRLDLAALQAQSMSPARTLAQALSDLRRLSLQ